MNIVRPLLGPPPRGRTAGGIVVRYGPVGGHDVQAVNIIVVHRWDGREV
ncbi:hypothetical protein [Gordonia terrae]